MYTTDFVMSEFLSGFNDIILPIIIFFWLTFIWNSYIDLRQYLLIKSVRDVPECIENMLTQSELMNSKAYQLDLITFSLIYDFYNHIELTSIVYFGFIFSSWTLVENCFSFMGFDSTYEILITQIWIIMLNFIFTCLHQPWDLFKLFFLEQKHGFNNMTLGVYFHDLMKKFTIEHVIILPTLCVFILMVKWGGDFFFIYAWISISVIIFILLCLYPTLIAPIFDTYTPLESGELRDSIQRLSFTVSFPLKEILIVDSSRKTAHSNAYFYGFWRNKRIVLFDTLFSQEYRNRFSKSVEAPPSSKDERLTEVMSDTSSTKKLIDNEADKDLVKFSFGNMKCEFNSENSEIGDGPCADTLSIDEITAIVCHEIGHWYYGHNLKSLLINETVLFFYCALFSIFLTNGNFFACFGFRENQPVIVGIVIIFGFIFAPLDVILSFCMNLLIRNFEYSADLFTAKLNMNNFLVSSLVKLTRDNKTFPIDDPLYSLFHKNHPSTLERISALGDCKTD